VIIIQHPRTKEEFKKLYALRYHVLREPIGLPRGTEKDDYEPISTHYIAVDDQTGDIVGTAKLFEKEPGVGQFSHIAVSDKYQNRGVGKLLVEEIEKQCRVSGYHTLGTLTRVTATGFYEKCGFKKMGISGSLFGKLQMMWMEKTIDT